MVKNVEIIRSDVIKVQTFLYSYLIKSRQVDICEDISRVNLNKWHHTVI